MPYLNQQELEKLSDIFLDESIDNIINDDLQDQHEAEEIDWYILRSFASELSE